MKIALVSTFDHHWGAAIACRRLAESLRTCGAEVRMVVQHRSLDLPFIEAADARLGAGRRAKARLLLEKLAFMPFDKVRKPNFAFTLGRFGMNLSRHPALQWADVIHLHWWDNAFLSLDTFARLADLQKPVVWTLHDMWAFTGGCFYSGDCTHYSQHCGECPFVRSPAADDVSARTWRRKQTAYARVRPSVVTCSAWLRDCAQASGLLRAYPVEAIPNPLDTDVFFPGDKAAARRRFNLPADKPLILFGSSRLDDPRKGFKYLQEARQILANKDVEIVAFGTGEAAVPGVHFVGALHTEAELQACYSACDVFALPSLADNLPNTVMEAMACGTPVVGFRIGGVPEMIDHLENGYVADFKSAEDLAEGLRYVLSDRHAALAAAAREKVQAAYGYQAVGRRYLAHYARHSHGNTNV